MANGDWPERQIVDQQLIGIFCDGLRDEPLKMKVVRDNPATFQAAVALATNEQNFRRRFSLRMGRITRGQDREEPMEVDHYRAGRRPV